MPSRGSDPLTGFSFSLDMSGQVKGFFTEVSGLSSESDIIEHKVVDDKGRDLIQKIPGRLKFSDVTLKRGVTSDMDFYQWRKLVEDGNITAARVNASITMYDQSLKAVGRWDMTNAWPVKISGPSLNSDSTAFVVEELTITFEYLVRSL